MDSNKSRDDHDMEEHRSTNEDVDPNASLDDFIQQNIVKESALKDFKEGDLANVSTHVAGDNESLFPRKESGLIDLPMGGRSFTWMNKFDRIDFEKVVKDKWDDITGEVLGHTKSLHTKLKDLKSHLKIWYSHTKEVKTSRMNLLLVDMRNLDQKINEARVKWEVEGDENSKFFHGLINSRRKSQSIHGIMHEGVWLSDPKDIKEAFLNFYKKKFSFHDSKVSFPIFMLAHHLNTSDQDLLEAVVSMKDIKTAEFVVSFLSWGKFPQGVNSAFITLIPKVSNPLFIKDYRPISLIGLHYKIVAKILSNRLSKVIDSIISPERSAFILGRQILDGPLILSEIINWYKKRKKKLMLFKVDFEKAFNYVSWKYLDYMLHKLGFGSRWRTWINNCLMSARTSILINGSPTSEFSLKRDWNQNDIENITMILNIFYIAFGLKINFHKSNVFGVGISNSEVVSMAACTGCEACSFPFSCLGLPIGSNMSRIANWQILIDRFKARLSGWKANLLSIGGRLTLIRSMLGSLVNSVRKHIDEHSLPSLFSCTQWYKMIPKKIGPTGLIPGMFLRTKRAVCIPSLRLLVGLFGILGTISHSALIL
nr:RNA-directed DNA polymerase, eukaryota, reverse transcriptase zinc-binding domain protein [Tanacetum cinerariifolium]